MFAGQVLTALVGLHTECSSERHELPARYEPKPVAYGANLRGYPPVSSKCGHRHWPAPLGRPRPRVSNPASTPGTLQVITRQPIGGLYYALRGQGSSVTSCAFAPFPQDGRTILDAMGRPDGFGQAPLDIQQKSEKKTSACDAGGLSSAALHPLSHTQHS